MRVGQEEVREKEVGRKVKGSVGSHEGEEERRKEVLRGTERRQGEKDRQSLKAKGPGFGRAGTGEEGNGGKRKERL